MLTVLSPHLDDAVLSTWSVLVSSPGAQAVTCFAGVPDADRPLAAWDRRCGYSDPATASRTRRVADTAALAACGARAVHLDLLDVDYRTTGPRETVEQLAAVLRPLVQLSTEVLLPAGLGLHLDHRLTALAALEALRSAPDVRVRVYADQPYASVWGWPSWVTSGGEPYWPYAWTRHVLRHRRRDMATQWSSAMAKLRLPRGLPHQVVALDDAQLEAKLAALDPYREQLEQLTYGPHGTWTLRQAMAYEAWWVLRGPSAPRSSRS